MQTKSPARLASLLAPLTLTLFLVAGCKTQQSRPSTSTSASSAAPSSAAASIYSAAPEKIDPVAPPVRIRAGFFEPFTDSRGNRWLPDQAFADGETIERDPGLPIANTQDPDLYRTERYSMTSFSYPVPNGKYLVRLHFAETFEGIYGPGERVFSFNVEGQPFKDFDVWVKAGGPNRAYIEEVNVTVADGKLDITFERNIENPEINGIEILPAQ
ncbi:MAG TPA: hypothetical protein GYA07_12515 [Verrucomicrobia bacterium]|nr:hypothetical protein [Verrucomicrobiota bacterium]HOP97377.1 malectin [Verrucomicrobiota bacterium]HPU55287.1 malectin [Verrucomicrobiota bacterium]